MVNVVEFPACVRPTRHLDQRRRAVRRGGPIQTVEAGVAIGMKEAAAAAEQRLGVDAVQPTIKMDVSDNQDG